MQWLSFFAAHCRFRTNADIAGVERLAVTIPDSAYLESPYTELPCLENSGKKNWIVVSHMFIGWHWYPKPRINSSVAFRHCFLP